MLYLGVSARLKGFMRDVKLREVYRGYFRLRKWKRGLSITGGLKHSLYLVVVGCKWRERQLVFSGA